MKDVIAFNFDGMIYHRINKWDAIKYADPNYGRGSGITDEQIKSLIEDIQKAGYDISVISNRIGDTGKWLDDRGIKPDKISKEEPLAVAHFDFYVDDSIEIDKSICSDQLLNLLDLS